MATIVNTRGGISYVYVEQTEGLITFTCNIPPLNKINKIKAPHTTQPQTPNLSLHTPPCSKGTPVVTPYVGLFHTFIYLSNEWNGITKGEGEVLEREGMWL